MFLIKLIYVIVKLIINYSFDNMTSLLNIDTIEEFTQILIVDSAGLADLSACVTNAFNIITLNKDRLFIITKSHFNTWLAASSVNLLHTKEVSNLDNLIVLFK